MTEIGSRPPHQVFTNVNKAWFQRNALGGAIPYEMNGSRLVSKYFKERHAYKPPKFGSGDKPLFLPRLIGGNNIDITEGNFPVYGYSHFGSPYKYFNGLEYYVRTEGKENPPSYYFDNHHLCVFAFAEALSMGYLVPGFTVLQLDGHEDVNPVFMEGEPFPVRPIDFKQIMKYIKLSSNSTHNSYCLLSGLASRVWALGQDWKQAAQEFGSGSFDKLFYRRTELLTLTPPLPGKGRVISVKYDSASINDLLGTGIHPNELALVVDLDLFVPKGSKPADISRETIIKTALFVKQIADFAGLLVVATSPGFSNHPLAVKIAQRIAALMM